MSVIFLFIDGVGLGEFTSSNPLATDALNGLSFISGGEPLTNQASPIKKENHSFIPVDATLGIDGLPQSGTGQAALFTGTNAAKEIGKHFGPYPHSGVKPLLKEQSLFTGAQEQGASCTFINAYPDVFFRKAEERNRWTCTTLMTKSAGIPLNNEQRVIAEKALTAGLTQEYWHQNLNPKVPVIVPGEAAERLIQQTKQYDIILHEYYLSDKAGHRQEKKIANKYLEEYDQFLWTLIQQKPENTTIVLCSDHGNLEDLSTKTHTRNDVPLFAYGPGAGSFHQAKSIMDVTPAILNVL